MEGVEFGGFWIPSLLFADDVVQFEAAGTRISTTKTETMVLTWKRVDFPVQVGEELLPQVDEFKYLGILFMSEGKKWSGRLIDGRGQCLQLCRCYSDLLL